MIGSSVRVVTVFLLLLTWGPPFGIGQDVTIFISGPGSNAQYIEQGKTEQMPVGVKVGQTVRWQNLNTTRNHTATAANQDGDLLFDTGILSSNGAAADVPITREIFERAGGTPGGLVTVEYECEFHPQMISYLVICDHEDSGGGDDVGDGTQNGGDPLLSIRRDITTLTGTELRDYRDAWRAIQTSGVFADIAGMHGCPQQFCHRAIDGPVFQPWHREYMRRLEQALQSVNPAVALHYWKWNSSQAAIDGIPAAFTDATYFSGGSAFPNPLRSFTFTCPAGSPPETTTRFPQPPFALTGISNLVGQAYLSTNYIDFNFAIEQPHNSLHGWVSGDMGSISTASYDPIFWAHHSNVDRHWASWQEAGGPDPTAGVNALPLSGFPGRTVGDVNDFRALGYEYDSYDSMSPIVAGPEFAMQSPQTQGGEDRFRKSFSVRLPASSSAELATRTAQNINLVVKGIPDHPKDSFVVHVFLNSPKPTKSDIRKDNPNYLGQFGIFGGQHGADHNMQESAMQSRDKTVLQFAPPVIRSMSNAESANRPNQVTILAMNTKGEVVPIEQVPITSVRVETKARPRSAPTRRRPESSRGANRIESPRITGQPNRTVAESIFAAGNQEQGIRFSVEKYQSKLNLGNDLKKMAATNQAQPGLESIKGIVQIPTDANLENVQDQLRLPDIGEFFFDTPETLCLPDERQQITTTDQAPWNGICLLVITLPDGRKAVGTGWFVSPQLVVTAGHCVHQGDGGDFFSSVEVIPGANGLVRPFGSKEVASSKLRASDPWIADGRVADDYGAILLPEPFVNGDGEGPSLFKISVATDLQLQQAMLALSGYPADKPTGTQWSASGTPSQVQANRIRYMIDTFGGHSGSPVNLLLGSNSRVVGIHNYGGCPNKCTRITAAVMNDINQWLNESQGRLGK